jgi:hypothetical protein
MKTVERNAYEALINRVNNHLSEIDESSLWLLKGNHKTTKALWRTINTLEDLNEILPGFVESGLLSEEALTKLRSAKWQIIKELEPIAHEALKAERKHLPELAKECSRRLMDD